MPCSVTMARPATSRSSIGAAPGPDKVSDTVAVAVEVSAGVSVSDTCGNPRRSVKRQCSSDVDGSGSSAKRFAASSRVIVLILGGRSGGGA